jgi:DNA replication and repair protein RecF
VILEELGVQDFRNIEAANLTLAPGRTVILGDNGQGKTNLLEAIHLLCTTRAFRTHQHRRLIRQNQKSFSISGRFASELRGTRSGVAKRDATNLIFELDGEPVKRLADYYGHFPLVLLAPEMQGITQGGPDQRRRFMDRLMCMSSPLYLDLLSRYQRALKQRTSLLMQLGTKAPGLCVFETELAACAIQLTQRRADFLASFRKDFVEMHATRFEQDGEADLVYKPSVDLTCTEDEWVELYRARRESDLQRGWCGLGPQRDEIDFLLHQKVLRLHGSQGQHKLFLLCLVLAETQILKRKSGEQPLLLLDDLFGMLDDRRIARIEQAVDPATQIVITTTSKRHLDVLSEGDLRVVECRQGSYQSV